MNPNDFWTISLRPAPRLGGPLPAESSASHTGIDIILETEHRSAAAEVVLAASTRRAWISPAIVELGGMRQLTLLQGSSIEGGCDLNGDGPSCGF